MPVFQHKATQWLGARPARDRGGEETRRRGRCSFISLADAQRRLVCAYMPGAGMIEVADSALQRLDLISLDAARDADGLHGKTGAGSTEDGAWEGWYVGYVDAGEGPGVVFALYARSDDYADIRDFRRAFAVELLSDAG